MKSRITPVFLFVAVLVRCGVPWCASNVSVSPESIHFTDPGFVTVTANVETGSEVTLEIFADFDGDGEIDSEDIATRTFQFTDGEIPAVTHRSLVYDLDEVENGQIEARIQISGEPPPMAGKHAIKVTDSSGSATAALQLTTPGEWTASISGTITRNGVPQPGVAALSYQRGEGERLLLALTDEEGAFSVPVPEAGDWGVIGIVPGYVSRFEGGSAAMVAVGEGESVALSAPLAVFDGTYSISGRVAMYDGNDWTIGVPGVSIIVENMADEDETFSIAFADEDGHFTAPSDEGAMEVFAQPQNTRGIVIQYYENVMVEGNVTDFILEAEPIDAVIKGTITNTGTDPEFHKSLDIQAKLWGEKNYAVEDAVTDENGNYEMGVVAGDWCLELDEDVLAFHDYVVTSWPNLPVSVSQGQSVSGANFTISSANCYLNVEVRKITGGGEPFPGMHVYLLRADNGQWVAGVDADDQGVSRFGVTPGTYRVGIPRENLIGTGFLAPSDIQVSIAEGEEKDVTLVLTPSTASAQFAVKDPSGNPVVGYELSVSRVIQQSWDWLTDRTTDGSGEALFELDAGDFVLTESMRPGLDQDYTAPNFFFSLEAGQNLNFSYTVYPKDGTLIVHVEDYRESPVEYVHVYIQEEASATQIDQGDTNSSGNISFVVPSTLLVVNVADWSVPPGLNPPGFQQVLVPKGGSTQVTFVLTEGAIPLEGDVNMDHVVDGLDLLIIMRQWGQTW